MLVVVILMMTLLLPAPIEGQTIAMIGDQSNRGVHLVGPERLHMGKKQWKRRRRDRTRVTRIRSRRDI